MYQQHPSEELNRLFERSPYQGVPPSEATFLFIGLDANYHPAIAQQAIFPRVLEYHVDGPSFWRRHGVHHPFLLPQYTGDGQYYHRSFARIGFQPRHAGMVSFIELLHRPTVGQSKLEPADLHERHLDVVNAAITNGRARHVFIPAGVARLMRATDRFAWLPRAPVPGAGPLKVWMSRPGKTVYAHLHLSVYGKFERQKTEELAAIGRLIDVSG